MKISEKEKRKKKKRNIYIYIYINFGSLEYSLKHKGYTPDRITYSSLLSSLSLLWLPGIRNRRSPPVVVAFEPSPIWIVRLLRTPTATPMALRSTTPVARRGFFLALVFSLSLCGFFVFLFGGWEIEGNEKNY